MSERKRTVSDYLSLQSGIILNEVPTSEEEMLLEDRQLNTLHLYLSLLSTFLYMSNYYVVAPTSGSYAEYLGLEKEKMIKSLKSTFHFNFFISQYF